jgi:hypothetical protein
MTKSKGLGDSIAKLTHALGIDILAEKIAHALGKEDCGCERRREQLNSLVPYDHIAKERYNFTEPRLFEVLKDIVVNTTGAPHYYVVGEVILISPQLPVYYLLKSFLEQGAVKEVSNQ